MPTPDDPSPSTTATQRTPCGEELRPDVGQQLDALLECLMKRAAATATIDDEEEEPTIQYGPAFFDKPRSSAPRPPARPSGPIHATQTLTAMPSRIAIRGRDGVRVIPAGRVETLLNAAVEALLARDHSAVVRALRGVLTLEPTHPQALANLARLEYLGLA